MSAIVDRRALAGLALEEAALARRTAGLSDTEPISPFDAAENLGITVRFVSVSMEGMYRRGSRPDIVLSCLRPLGRRVFTCAHEIGHDRFGHGSAIDELREDCERNERSPEEFLADAFAGFFLMPPIGVRGAMVRRGLTPEDLGPKEIYRIACSFGVGYETMVTHLAYGLRLLSPPKAKALGRRSVASVRREFLSRESTEGLIVVDEEFEARTIDVEVGCILLLAPDLIVTGDALAIEEDGLFESFVRAVRPGIARLCSEERQWSCFVRVMANKYVGLAKYRHMEGCDE